MIILTDYTYEEALNEYPFIFILIYSEICKKCMQYIIPLFTSLYKEIEENEQELKHIVAIAKIDGSHNKNFIHKYNIIGYPTLLLLNKENIQAELIHMKNVDDMIVFLRKYILMPIQFINNINQFKRLEKNNNKESFVTYYGNDVEEINALKEIRNKYKHLTFINIQDEKLIYELNATKGQLSINKHFDEPKIIESNKNKNNKKWTSYDINKFIKKYNHKLLIEFTTKQGEAFIKQKKNLLLLINKQELSESQKKTKEYMDKINIKEFYLTDENKENNKIFVELAKGLRDIVQSSYVIYIKNMINIKDINSDNKRKEKRRIIFDEDDPFGFEAKRQEIKDCEKRQIKFVSQLHLNNETNCEIRLLDFNNSKFYKLNCGREYIQDNINFVKNWYNKNNFNISNQSFELNLN